MNEGEWISEFQILSSADLDFVIGQEQGFPVGMMRSSPPEFRRKVLSAVISCFLGLNSIDYAQKRYVRKDEYENEETSLGDLVSDYLFRSSSRLHDDLRNLHTQEGLTYGQFGAELSLFKFPETLDLARMLANRGLLLEVLPILRLALEMIAWSAVAFTIEDEETVDHLKAQKCITQAKEIYESAGQIYGYLSKFAHWEQAVHPNFLSLKGTKTGVIRASCRYRAMSLTLCLIILDVFVEVVRSIYSESARSLILNVQGIYERTNERKVHQMVDIIVGFSKAPEFEDLRSLLR